MAKLPKAVFADKINGVIKFGERKYISGSREAFYDYSYFEVPFIGEFHAGKVWSAIRPRIRGQFNSLGEVKLVRPGVLQYEVIHSIGD